VTCIRQCEINKPVKFAKNGLLNLGIGNTSVFLPSQHGVSLNLHRFKSRSDNNIMDKPDSVVFKKQATTCVTCTFLRILHD